MKKEVGCFEILVVFVAFAYSLDDNDNDNSSDRGVDFVLLLFTFIAVISAF